MLLPVVISITERVSISWTWESNSFNFRYTLWSWNNEKQLLDVLQVWVELVKFYSLKPSLSRRFYDKRDAEDALDAMDGRMLDGRELRVQMARYGRPTSPYRSRHSRSSRRR